MSCWKTFVAAVFACTLMLCAISTFVSAQGAGGPFGALVNANGDISFPKDFPAGFEHIGTVAIASGTGVTETHSTYARPADVAYYRANNAFPDGAVLIKHVENAIGSPHTTGRAFWPSETKTWFLMLKDRQGRYPTHPLWGDGWGWGQFDPKEPAKQIATNYRTDCLRCHLPAKASDWVYVYAYPRLGELARQFTPQAARASTVAYQPGSTVPSSNDTAATGAGKAAFEGTCAVCHTVEAGQHLSGPSLFGIVGRKAGAAPNYAYSAAMKAATVSWSRETLLTHLADPNAVVPGNRMARSFRGVESEEARQAIVSYLETIK